MFCKHSFQNQSKVKKNIWIRQVYHEYSSGKQTLEELSQKYRISKRTIQRSFDKLNPCTGEIISSSKPINLILDATFFGRSYGILVARANKKNLLWQEIETERIQYYADITANLEYAGFTFASFTIDGRRGVKTMLKRKYPNTPIQHCHFHQIQTVTKYISKRPRLEAGRELRKIVLILSKALKQNFANDLEAWYGKWQDFLKEKTNNFEAKKWYYTHKKLRSAYFSLKRNLPYLFVFQDYPELNIPTTTNSCDGSFAHWKQKIKIHRGLKKHRRKKMIDYLLEN